MPLESIRQETVKSNRRIVVPEPLENAERVAWFDGLENGVAVGDVDAVDVAADDDAFVDVTGVFDGYVRPPAALEDWFEVGETVLWLRYDRPADRWNLMPETAFLELVNPDDDGVEGSVSGERRLDYDADVSGIEALAPDLFLSAVADRFDTVEPHGNGLVFEGQEMVVPPALVDAMADRGAVVSRMAGDRVTFGRLDIAVVDDDGPGSFSLDVDVWGP
ncbi:MAG: hypothetical protein SV186_04910 [Candidatus Nanohaloarchaea archaeon]|nr:hypothetical protein [Candidatus Nanohaloarchaea archaeon]